jgi:hypothetical protein
MKRLRDVRLDHHPGLYIIRNKGGTHEAN